MSRSRAIATHTIIQIISKALNILLGMTAFSLLTQYLGQGGFGKYTIITTFLGIFGIIADMGLSVVAIQMISERPEKEQTIFNNILLIRIVTALLALGLAPCISLFLPYSLEVKYGIALTFLSFVFSSLIQLFTSLFQQRIAMVFPFYADILGRIVLLGGIITLIIFHKGLPAILVLMVVANAFQCLLLYVKACHLFPIRFIFDRSVIIEVITRAWPIALSVTFNLVYLKADTLILSLFRPEADVGLYGASYRILEVLVTIPMMFMGISLSSFTDAWAKNDLIRFNRYLQKSFDALLIIALPLVVGTILVAPQLMVLISGNEFAISGSILQILILATGMVFIGTLFGHLINIIHAQKKMMWGYASGALFGLIGYIITIPLFSFWGAAWMTVATEAFIMSTAFAVFYQQTGLYPRLHRLLPISLATIVMAVLVWFSLPYIHIIWVLLLGACVYPVALFAFKGISLDEALLILPLKKAYILKE